MFGDLTSYLKRHRKQREIISELNARSDRELDDIGITRGDIPAVARKASRK